MKSHKIDIKKILEKTRRRSKSRGKQLKRMSKVIIKLKRSMMTSSEISEESITSRTIMTTIYFEFAISAIREPTNPKI
jgi:hypothetical protein